jgi:hypothetical protein
MTFRFTIYRATQLGGENMSTGPRNIHLDLNPWWWLESSQEVLDGLETITYEKDSDLIKENNLVVRSMGRHVQCVLNFTDNLEEDGGTIVVPKFHRYIEKWSRDNAALRRPIPWLTMESDCDMLPFAQRVPMRRGSVLVWDQTVFHGTSPNRSCTCRTAQYLKAFPRACMSEQRLNRRSSLVRQMLEKNNSISVVTPLGVEVFGL